MTICESHIGPHISILDSLVFLLLNIAVFPVFGSRQCIILVHLSCGIEQIEPHRIFLALSVLAIPACKGARFVFP